VRGHYYQSTAQETIALTAANLSNPRIDTIIIELDPSANTIVLKAIAGDPAVSPTPEPLVQTDAGVYQIKLADVLVDAAATTISSGKVTDERSYIEDFTGTVPGSAITGEITDATIDGDRLFGNIDSATIAAANVTGLTVSAITDLTATATELNYTDGVTSSIQTQLESKAPLTPAVNAKTGAYTLVVGDRGEFVTADGTFTITVPASVFSAGDRVDFVNIGTGVVTFAAGAGLTLNSVEDAVTIDTQWAGASVFFTSATTAVLVGRLA